MLDALPADSAVLVDEEDDLIRGVALVTRAPSGPTGYTAKLDALYVLPSHQRKGIGQRLFQAALEWAYSQGHQGMFLWVFRDNPYRRFYESVDGRLLDAEQVDDFGGTRITSVAYGWRQTDSPLSQASHQPL